ncbi:MAG: flagellar biosynthesis anti-sigma factor FlgM [Lachnospiraceae bacterium]|nr:flagellar biosynthesis anti-sigma factor FlgM [Lachnospiraceae bacterium]MBR3736878.1 flagellar biosynthesis anti-sigma factor FlgM [Lachnospiraceae bacterium]MBR6158028.1 flagellar biosynthesis anti-sigma factor FlgM [Lachnospiraceae bacterium]
MRVDAYSQIQNLYNVSKPAGNRGSAKTAVPDFKDRLNISGQGKDLQVAKQAVAAAPDIREDRVAALKAAYQSGTYNISANAVADKILENYEF